MHCRAVWSTRGTRAQQNKLWCTTSQKTKVVRLRKLSGSKVSIKSCWKTLALVMENSDVPRWISRQLSTILHIKGCHMLWHFSLNVVAFLVRKKFDIFLSSALLLLTKRPRDQGIYSSQPFPFLCLITSIFSHYLTWPLYDIVVNSLIDQQMHSN